MRIRVSGRGRSPLMGGGSQHPDDVEDVNSTSAPHASCQGIGLLPYFSDCVSDLFAIAKFLRQETKIALHLGIQFIRNG